MHTCDTLLSCHHTVRPSCSSATMQVYCHADILSNSLTDTLSSMYTMYACPPCHHPCTFASYHFLLTSAGELLAPPHIRFRRRPAGLLPLFISRAASPFACGPSSSLYPLPLCYPYRCFLPSGHCDSTFN